MTKNNIIVANITKHHTKGCGEIDVTNGKVESISSNGTVSLSCNGGYFSNKNTSTCLSSGKWSVPTIACSPPEKRLIGKLYKYF
jgi:hypothetical protein